MVKYKKTTPNLFRNSLIIGLVVLALDFLGHTFLTNRTETLYYYLAKPIISGYVAYFMFLGIYNLFSLKKNTAKYYIYYATLFAFIHGAYYRILDFLQGKPFLDRVDDIVLGGIVLLSSNIITAGIGWLIIHGGAFLIGVFIAKRLMR